MRHHRIIGLLFSLCIVRCIAYAVPAREAFFDAYTAEGERVNLTLRGDEYGAWYEDQEGIRWIEEKTFFRRASKQECLSQDQHRAQSRRLHKQAASAPSIPQQGTVRVVVLLAQYSDKKFVIQDPVARFTRFFNEAHYADNGSTGSVSDYYLACSNGALHVVYDVYGPYTLSHDEAYYGGNTDYSSNKNAQELVKEVAKLAENAGVDFTKYDNTNGGYIDLVSVVTAGHNEAEGGSKNSIWPHKSYVWDNTRVSGKALSAYLMVSELRGSSGTNMANIGTYCHEFGHVLGLPDLYNTKQKDTYTVGTWDLMCSGCYNNLSRTPPVCSAFERFMLGWLTPQQLSSAQQMTIGAMEQTNKAYLIAASTHNLNPTSPSPSEYFLIENRQRQGWDSVSSCLPGTGLLISHITYSATGWNDNTFNNAEPLGYAIEEAYNPSPKQSSASDTYPGSGSVSAFTPTLNSGKELADQTLTNIYERNNGEVSFVYKNPSNLVLRLEPQVLDTFVSTFDRQIVQYGQQKTTLVARNSANKKLHIGVSGRYEISWDGEQWSDAKQTLTDSIDSNTYRRELFVRFAPIRKSCSLSTGQLTVFTEDSTDYTLTTLYGVAPRPVYISAVDSLYAEAQTTSSFRIGWKEEEDADYYYVTLLQQVDSNTFKRIERREVIAPNTAAIFSDLPSGTVYKVTVEAAEQKSCWENIAPASEIITHTYAERTNSRLPVARTDDGKYWLITETPVDFGSTMAIYDSSGRLITRQTVAFGAINPEIPTKDLQRGELYGIKLYTEKMRRKDLWAKFIYY